MRLYEQTLTSQQVYQGKIIDVYKDTVQLENGAQATRELVHHPGGVCVLALNEKNEVLMVHQFRYAYKSALWEVPAGKRDAGEDPLDCGKRELLEETGAVASEYIDLGTLYPTPAYLDEVIHLYLARGLTFQAQNLDADEFLEVETIALDKLVEMVMNNQIKDAKTQVAVLKADQYLRTNSHRQ